MAIRAPKPQPYAHPNFPGLHQGVVTVTGSLTVDLGIRHNNFIPHLTPRGVLADIATAPSFAWAYGSKKGTFTITVTKRPAAYGAWIAATVALDFAFIALETTPVG